MLLASRSRLLFCWLWVLAFCSSCFESSLSAVAFKSAAFLIFTLALLLFALSHEVPAFRSLLLALFFAPRPSALSSRFSSLFWSCCCVALLVFAFSSILISCYREEPVLWSLLSPLSLGQPASWILFFRGFVYHTSTYLVLRGNIVNRTNYCS